VFSWSYRALSEPARRLFRLLGLHPGPSASVPAVAALAGLHHADGDERLGSEPAARPDARRLLAELCRANLLVQHVPGRYTWHDLLRAYAADLTASVDPAQVRAAATRRLLDHYLHTAHAADRLLDPARGPMELPLPAVAPDAEPEQLADRAAATAWLLAEHPVLLALVRHAAAAGHDAYAWQLTWTLSTFLDRQGLWRDRATAWQLALQAAERLGDSTAQARAHTSIARTHTLSGNYADSDISLHRALALYTRIGDEIGQAHTHRNFAHLWGHQGRYDIAVKHADEALARYRSAGDRRGQADALNQVGWYHAMAGDHARALTFCTESVHLHEELGNRAGQAHAWDSLGYAHHHLGHHSEAVDCYRNALRLARDLGDRYNQTQALTHLGETHLAAGHVRDAREAWTEAVRLLTELGRAEAESLRARLDALS
jgi:tetratricopeptide (TPR) repeat protein